MKSKIQKWGNSLAIRIPKSFAVEMEIKQDSVIDLSVVDSKIIVEPNKSKPKYNLAELLDEINEDNIHSETDWGNPVGKEVL